MTAPRPDRIRRRLRPLLVLALAVPLLTSCEILFVAAAHVDFRETEDCQRGTAPLTFCVDGRSEAAPVLSDNLSDGLVLLADQVPGTIVELGLPPGSSFRLIGDFGRGECPDLQVDDTRSIGIGFLSLCVYGTFTAPHDGSVAIQHLGIPAIVSGYVRYRDTEGCRNGTIPFDVCAMGLDLALPVVGDDRSDGLITIPNRPPGIIVTMGLVPGTTFRLVAALHDGSCPTLVVDGVESPGTTFLTLCVYGAFTAPEHGSTPGLVSVVAPNPALP